MKKITIKYLVFFSLAFSSISCDKLEALIPDINLNVPLEFSIDVKATDPYDFESNFEVSGLNDSISKYTNLIKDYTIDSVNISLIELVIPDTNFRKYPNLDKINGSQDWIKFELINNDAKSLIPSFGLIYNTSQKTTSIQNFQFSNNVYIIMAGGKGVNLNLPFDNLAAISYALKNSNKLSGKIRASSHVKPIKLKFRLNVYAKAKTH